MHISTNRCVYQKYKHTHTHVHMHAGTHIKTHRIYLLSKTQSDRMHLTISVCSKTWIKFEDSHGCWCVRVLSAGRIWTEDACCCHCRVRFSVFVALAVCCCPWAIVGIRFHENFDAFWTHLLSKPASIRCHFIVIQTNWMSLVWFFPLGIRVHKIYVAKSKCSVSGQNSTNAHCDSTINIRYFWPKHSNENSIFERIQKKRRRKFYRNKRKWTM